jgi:hypothetical protein
MDTAQTLADARQLAAQLVDDDGAGGQLARTFRELDTALTGAERLPADWARAVMPSLRAMVAAVEAIPSTMAAITTDPEDVADEILAALADQPDEQTRHRFTHHRNQLDDWCPWSHVKVSVKLARSDDTQCPAGCPASDIEEVPADEQ